VLVAATLATARSAPAQEITGTPGSPGATVTVDGKQLPPQSFCLAPGHVLPFCVQLTDIALFG
jgi:hypothetical protein